MTRRLAEFDHGARRARDLVGLGQSIGSMTQGVVDAQDLYRASLVQAVSAMDYYMHGVVLDLAVDVVLGARSPGAADRKFGLPLEAVQQIVNTIDGVSKRSLVIAHLSERLRLETMQSPDDISKALARVGVAKIWSTAFAGGANATKTSLGVVVSRRNRIVHQSDADPLSSGIPTPITDVDALEAVKTVELVVRSIDPHCS